MSERAFRRPPGRRASCPRGTFGGGGINTKQIYRPAAKLDSPHALYIDDLLADPRLREPAGEAEADPPDDNREIFEDGR